MTWPPVVVGRQLADKSKGDRHACSEKPVLLITFLTLPKSMNKAITMKLKQYYSTVLREIHKSNCLTYVTVLFYYLLLVCNIKCYLDWYHYICFPLCGSWTLIASVQDILHARAPWLDHLYWHILLFPFSSANKMQKQVEIRMHESHLDPPTPPEESMCGGFCEKMMRNMLLMLTILGKLKHFCYFSSF